MSIEVLLSRLQKVKSNGKGRWTCECPSHHDRSPSMHIKLEDDGKILINCKAGCDVYSIVSSVGMHLSDLMPDNPTHHRQKPRQNIMYVSEALELIRFEAQVIMACAYAIRIGDITQNDIERAEEAMQRINKCLELTK